MENVYHLPHTFSKKSYTGKSMYDDVFTGPQKFVATSLAPRLEDYSEIFGGFHGSRGRVSSIPVLDLSPVDDVELIVLRSDYSEVFGGFHGVEFASTFEDLVDGANGGYESSDEAWSPAHSGSLSEETDPSACSKRSHSTTSRDKHHPVDGINQFNISFHKAHQTSDGDVTTGMAHITHFEAIPGYTCIVEENVASENNNDEKRPHQDGFGVRVAEEKTYNKSVSLPMSSDIFQKRGSRLNPWETRSKSGPILIEPLITVSDISLRTRPSHLPPPSRPPPVLAAGRGESRITHPKPKTTRSLSVASLDDALCRTEENPIFSANSSDFRDEGLQTYLQMEVEEDKECLSTMPYDLNNNVGDAVQWSSDGTYGEIETNSSEKSVKEHRKDHASSLGSSKAEEIVSWREAAEYFEVETDFCRKDYRQSKKETFGNTDIESFGNQWYRKTTTKPKDSCDKPRLGKMAPETNITEQRVMHEEIKKVLHSAKHMETQDEDCTQHKNVADTDRDMKGPFEITETKLLDVNLEKESELVSEEVFEIDHLMKINNESEQRDVEDKANERQDQEEKEKQQNEALGIPRTKKIQKKAHVRIGPKTSESVEQMDEYNSIHHICKRVDVHHAHEQYKKDGEQTLTTEAEREIAREYHKLEEDDIELRRSFTEDKFGTEQKEMRSEEALDHERNRASSTKDSCEKGTRKEPIEANGTVTSEKNEDTGLAETSSQKAEMNEPKKHVTKEEFEQGHPASPTASVNVPEKPFNNVAKIVVASDLEVKVTFPEMQRKEFIAGMQFAVGEGVPMKKLTKPQLASEWVDNAKNISDALQTVLVDIGDIQDDYEADASQGTETKVNNLGETPLPEEPIFEKQSRNDGELKHENYMAREKDPMAKTQKVGGLKGRELQDEHLKMIEEEREREREREKDRTAVENTVREARERTYVDARERAALERATSETRQRAMAEARERLEKASAEAREARVKAERAAVERATAEARQRAFDKAMSAKCNSETTDKFSSKEMKQRGPTYDSCNIQIQSGLKYTYSSSQVGVEGESPQRCKARLERYQRTANRAAQALAEKNKRDLVAQREQEERSRLAEMLDADVKRWSNGKEGNLRALLSTLQYILGPDSGWQPIPLTEVITSAAVKRAYRKATLCVHPDKLQQRGANTQQKYMCEKIFDLLKEAWNKFNSEER